MTKKEKEIRQKWHDFTKNRQKQERIYLSKDEITKVMSSFFR